jgi:AcrR family transcriptional regulator
VSARVNGRGAAASKVRREGGHVVEMQRRRLLLAMRELAGEDGLERVTVGRVCKRSRVSRRTFYDLFDDRDACFLAAFEQALERIGESVLPAYEQQERWRDRIRAGLEGLLVLFDEQPWLARLCVIETPKGGPAVLARRRQILDALAVAVDEGRREARGGSGPPALTAESTVGGVLAVIHARLLDPDAGPLVQLVAPLTGMIVHPYLGRAASRREMERPGAGENGTSQRTPRHRGPESAGADPFRDLRLRFTYRTARVLATIAAHPGASNRQVGEDAGVSDQGQISKLLKRLERAGLVENDGPGRESGEPNAWQLTTRGWAIDAALGVVSR